MLLLLIACYIPGIVGIASDGILPPRGDFEVLASGGAGRGYTPADLMVETEGKTASGEWTTPVWGVGMQGMVGLRPKLALRLNTQLLGSERELAESNLALDLFYSGSEHLTGFIGLDALHLHDTDTFIIGYGPQLGIIYGLSLPQDIRPYGGLTLGAQHYREGGNIVMPGVSLGLSWRPSHWFVAAEGVAQWGFDSNNQWDMNGALLGGMLSIGFN